MRKRLISIAMIFSAMFAASAVPAAAHEKACNGLNRAHENTHGSGSRAEQQHHDLRAENGCSH